MDRKLLLNILGVHDVKIDHEEIAKAMATDDSKPTAGSISNRISKLKAMAKKEVGGRYDGACTCLGSPSAKASQCSAPGTNEGSPKATTPKSRARKCGSMSGNDDDHSPKKVRKTAKVKAEDLPEDEEVPATAVVAKHGDGDGENST